MKLSEIKNTVDERIVRLNEIIATKLSSVPKNRREQLRKDKCLAEYVIDNYDSKDTLNAILKDQEVEKSEVVDIVTNRVKELKRKLAAKTSKRD